MRPLRAEIRLHHLRENYQTLKQIHGGKLLAVVKADAYGHGAVRCAHALADLADGFAVACIEEAIELREHGSHRLLAVAVTDLVDGALSAVYTFYDPDEAERGLGTLAVLKQLEWAARDRRAHLYLGYWIAGHAKMDYKRRFQPLEGFNGRGWARLQA